MQQGLPTRNRKPFGFNQKLVAGPATYRIYWWSHSELNLYVMLGRNQKNIISRDHASEVDFKDSGRVKKNSEPSPGLDSTQIRPPWCSTTLLQIARPMPVPGVSFP